MVTRKAASMWLEVNIYYEFLWNHVVIQQDWITLKIHEVSDFSNSQFLEKMQKLIHKLPKHFANCKLRTANLNPDWNLVPRLIGICRIQWCSIFLFLIGITLFGQIWSKKSKLSI